MAAKPGKRWHYSAEDLKNALLAAGLKRGDTVLSHVSLSSLGIAREMLEGKNPARLLYETILGIIGPDGNFLTPTFTYSFCRNEIYDPDVSPSTVGAFGEWLRKEPGIVRSLDPLFSHCGAGPDLVRLFANLPNTSFGADSLYERLSRAKAKVCNIGLSLDWVTARYHADWKAQIPYRYEKLFSGQIRQGETLTPASWLYFVRVNIPETEEIYNPIQDLALEMQLVSPIRLGLGEINAIALEDYYALCAEGIRRNPWYTVQGPACDLIAAEERRTGKADYPLAANTKPSPWDLLALLAPLPRDLISDGYDAALEALAQQAPMIINEYPSGTRAFTWIVPEKWQCNSATLKDEQGNVLLDSAKAPLCCVRYSLPYQGKVDAETLRTHLFSNSNAACAYPYIFKFYRRDWGFACPGSFIKSLPDGQYEVSIDTTFSYGTLKVGEVLAEGESAEGFVLCAHLDHPYQVNDGLSGVVAGMAAMQKLLSKAKRKYTWRLLILPETIGSAAWLSGHETLLPKIKGGYFLEMVALDLPFYYKKSFAETALLDQAMHLALKDSKEPFITGDCLDDPLNDERMFAGAGIRIPMGSLTRVDEKTTSYSQYHTELDDLAHASEAALNGSISVLNSAIWIVESNFVPKPLFKGEIFITRYNDIDYGAYMAAIDACTFYLDGQNSLIDIAFKSGCSYALLHELVGLYQKNGLIE